MSVLALIVLAAAAQAKAAPAEVVPSPRPAVTALAPAAADAPVAFVDGQPILASELEAAASGRLFKARTDLHKAQREAIDAIVDRRLLEREAARRGVTVDALLQQEVEARVPPVSPEEQRKVYEENKARVPPHMTEAEALKQIETGLRQRRVRERQAELVASLRAKADVRMAIEQPRAAVGVDDDPAAGPPDAPVTIVEFSDFQCPFCSRVIPTIKQVQARYGDSVRVVFRDYPIPQIHPHAAKAAEAATCAHEQGKFWAMHDLLFESQSRLSPPDLKQHAATLGLDKAAFDQCLDSGKHTGEWQKDAADGERYGVQSTPAFFINGRLVVGAQPYEEFAKVVEDELRRLGRPIPAPKPGAPLSE